MLHKNLSINKNGRLCFAGVDTVALAEKYGTPLMLLDEQGVRTNCREYLNAVRKHFGACSFAAYASKALCFVGLYKILKEEGMRVDVASVGELHTAAASGFDCSQIYFHGNNKTDDDIKYALSKKIGYFMVDNFDELERVDVLAKAAGIRQKIFLRLTPGVAAKTVKAIVTGDVDSKFGVGIAAGQAEKFVKRALELSSIELCGFHCHIGSQIFETEPFIKAAENMLAFIAEIKAKTGYEAKELILGGGFAVRYTEQQPLINYEKNIAQIAACAKRTAKALGVKMPTIGLEPGRSIVAANMLTLYTVGSVKEISGIKNYVIVDGSMADNPRYALYKSPYTLILANRAKDKPNFQATVAGRTCESGDIIQENVSLPKPVRGDILAVLVTGGYNYSMASNYNRLPRPPIVMIDKNGKDIVAVKRESLDDLIKLDAKI